MRVRLYDSSLPREVIELDTTEYFHGHWSPVLEALAALPEFRSAVVTTALSTLTITRLE